jgi:hypothetical protein
VKPIHCDDGFVLPLLQPPPVDGEAENTHQAEKHIVMDCTDCHNRAAHSLATPEDALNKDMAVGSPSASLPFVQKEGLVLLKADYAPQAEAMSKIASGLEDFYRSQYPQIWSGQRAPIDQPAKTLVAICNRNVFPYMKVTWGHTSQQHRSQHLPRMLPLPRWQSQREGRHEHPERLLGLP